MTALTDFLFPAPAPRTAGAILRWWERRRLPYNLIVGGAGTLSLGVSLMLSWLPPGGPGLDGQELGPPVVMFGVLANLFYCMGATVELAVERLWGRKLLPTGPTLYRMGLTFSVGLAFLPSMVMGLDWAVRLVRWLF